MSKTGDDKPAEGPKAHKVRWTKNGETSGAYSEHGQHKAGDIVETIHASRLIAQNWAEPILDEPKK